MDGAGEVIVEAAFLCLAAGGCFLRWLEFVERRDVRRFEQRAEMFRLKASAVKADDVEKLATRVRHLEQKGLR